LKLFLLGAGLVLLLVVPHNALAWNWANGFGPSLFGLGQGPYNNGYQAVIADAQYDHENNLVYNPYPQCCHSEYYQQAFHEGYDHQWDTYQVQNSEQRSNIYINNSPGAYVNTEQTSGQNQEQGPSWASPQCEQCSGSDNTNGDCSNGCPWGQGP
jgi:hypothetical protein